MGCGGTTPTTLRAVPPLLGGQPVNWALSGVYRWIEAGELDRDGSEDPVRYRARAVAEAHQVGSLQRHSERA